MPDELPPELAAAESAWANRPDCPACRGYQTRVAILEAALRRQEAIAAAAMGEPTSKILHDLGAE